MFLSLFADSSTAADAFVLLPPNNSNIQYFGRWDMSDSTQYRYSWPGICLCAEFTGTSVGVRLIDATNYFNVYVDGKLHRVLHCTKQGVADYVVAERLRPGKHTLRFSRRNITFEPPYSFLGVLLERGGTLVQPSPKSARKIEFIGDSFTVAESNEATVPSLPWEERYPVTNTDKGFAADIARRFDAQYAITARSGAGVFCDWRGDTGASIPKLFDRTLMESPEPKWDFTKWIPDVVVICLGLNDYSGLKEKDGGVPPDRSARFRAAYHGFLESIRRDYPNVKIVVVAAYPQWIRQNVKQVVDEEKASGKKDVFSATFDEFPGGYVAGGHPTVATHRRMADQIIKDMESFNLFNRR